MILSLVYSVDVPKFSQERNIFMSVALGVGL
jgi:hypothetical protein